jgi:hypothetical protein
MEEREKDIIKRSLLSRDDHVQLLQPLSISYLLSFGRTRHSHIVLFDFLITTKMIILQAFICFVTSQVCIMQNEVIL